MPNIIPCGELEATIQELQNRFQDCYVLKAEDLDLMLDIMHSISLCSADDFTQDNIFTYFATDTVTVEDAAFTDTDILTVINNGGPFVVGSTILPIFVTTIQEKETGSNQIYIKTAYYILQGVGAGTYGIGETQLEQINIFRLRVDEETLLESSNPVIVYEVRTSQDSNLTSPEIAVNAAVGPYEVVAGTDYYFRIILTESGVDTPLNTLWRYTGPTGNFGIAGGNTAVDTDFTLIEQLQTPISQNLFRKFQPDPYLGYRYDFVDPDIKGFFFGANGNFRNGITVYNEGTGNTATSSFVVTNQNAAFGNATSLQYFGNNYFGVPLRNSGGLYTNSKMTFTLANNAQFRVFSVPNTSLSSMSSTPVLDFQPGTMSWRMPRTTIQNINDTAVTQPRVIPTVEWIIDKYGSGGPNSTGLEALDEGNGTGWRLIGRDPANYGNIGLGAVDISTSDSAGFRGATGDYSFAAGLNNTVNSHYGAAFGENNLVQGTHSFAFGTNNSLTGGIIDSAAFGEENIITDSLAFAFGRKNNVSDPYSMASGALNTITQFGGHTFGGGLIANDYMTIAVGKANLNTTATGVTGGSSLNYNDSKLFVVGNGTISGGAPFTVTSRSDALVVYQGGEVTLPSLSNALIDSSGDEIAVTKGWITDKYFNPTGLEAINEGNGIGWRLIGKDPANYDNIGVNAIDISHSDQATNANGARATNSFVVGYNNRIVQGESSSIISGQGNIVDTGSTGFATHTITGGYANNTYDWSYASINLGSLNKVGTDGSTGLSEPVAFSSGALGYFNSIYAGRGTFGLGAGLTYGGAFCTVVGAANVDLTNTVANQFWAPSNDIAQPGFIVGIGDVFSADSNNPTFTRRNGFVVWRNGTAELPEATIAEIDSRGAKSVVTKEWVEDKYEERVSALEEAVLKRVKVSLSASDIQNLGTTPITAIPAPGVGKYIKIHTFDNNLTWGSTVFDATFLQLKYDGGAVIANGAFTLDVVADTFQASSLESVYDISANTEVVVSANADSIATGDSTVDVYITYEVIDL